MIYVTGDIHGNKRRFNSILHQIDLQPTDTLYILGDVIDRFPDGIRLLRAIMQMPNVRMLLGNHEYMMLNVIDGEPDRRTIMLWYQNGGLVTHDYIKHIRRDIRADIIAYLRALPLNMSVNVNGKKFKLVHGAPLDWYAKYGQRYDDEAEFAVWYRWSLFEPEPEGYTVIFGHTPTDHYQMNNPLSIYHGHNLIGIDCGGGYPEDKREVYGLQGRLACLRLDDMKEFYSEEMEDGYRE